MQQANEFQRKCVTNVNELLQASGAGEKEVMMVMNYAGLNELPEALTRSDLAPLIVWLYLKRNKIAYLPNSMCNMKNLVELYLDSNNLSSFPEVLVDLHVPCLESIDLSSNRLSRLPPDIGRLQALKKLRVCNNILQALPSEIGLLTNLEVLALMNNQLKAIPAEIGQCSSLKHLLLDKNLLSWVPRQLCQLRNLEELSVAGNILLGIPLDMGYIPSLKCVYVDNNPYLHSVPVSMMAKQLGINSCGQQNPLDDDLKHVHHITITDDDRKRIVYLPKELRKICNSKEKSLSTLLELSLRMVFKHHRTSIQPEDLPQELHDLVSTPVASCISCSVPIFSMAFPVIFEGQLRVHSGLYRLALCCSKTCVKLAAIRMKLPLAYPEDLHVYRAVVVR